MALLLVVLAERGDLGIIQEIKMHGLEKFFLEFLNFLDIKVFIDY